MTHCTTMEKYERTGYQSFLVKGSSMPADAIYFYEIIQIGRRVIRRITHFIFAIHIHNSVFIYSMAVCIRYSSQK